MSERLRTVARRGTSCRGRRAECERTWSPSPPRTMDGTPSRARRMRFCQLTLDFLPPGTGTCSSGSTAGHDRRGDRHVPPAQRGGRVGLTRARQAFREGFNALARSRRENGCRVMNEQDDQRQQRRHVGIRRAIESAAVDGQRRPVDAERAPDPRVVTTCGALRPKGFERRWKTGRRWMRRPAFSSRSLSARERPWHPGVCLPAARSWAHRDQ